MPIKSITAHEAKPGTTILIDGVACVVKSQDISKTGKHGSSKARIEAVGLIDDKKKIIIAPGHERLAVPMIEKRRGQILSIGEHTSIMDLESFETLDVMTPPDLKDKLSEGIQVEYWDIEGKKIIKRLV